MNWEPYFDRTPSEVWFDLVSTSQICRNYWIMKIFIKRHATLVIMFFSQLSYGLCIYWVEIDVAFKQCVIRIFLSSWPSSLFDCTNRVGKKYNSTNVKGKSLSISLHHWRQMSVEWLASWFRLDFLYFIYYQHVIHGGHILSDEEVDGQ